VDAERVDVEDYAWPKWRLATGRESDHIALYVQLSRIFRQRILSREWSNGKQIPTVVELCRELGVAAITVRQALKLLIDDGWIVSTRGKGTFVTDAVKAPHDNLGLRAAINDPLFVGSDLRIKLLRKTGPAPLPPNLLLGSSSESYVRISKLHVYQNTPFALMDIYVTKRAYDLFPLHSEQSLKISRLFREFGDISVKRDTQVFTVAYADQKAAAQLKYSLGGVLVCMRSWWFDADENVVFTGVFYYRGDMFVLERSGAHQAAPLLPAAAGEPVVVRKQRSSKRKATKT
jgi:GntR family transcriptional regulator